MDAIAVAAIVTFPPLLLAVWRDLRNRTNGTSPLAGKIDALHDEVRDLSVWQKSHIQRWHS